MAWAEDRGRRRRQRPRRTYVDEGRSKRGAPPKKKEEHRVRQEFLEELEEEFEEEFEQDLEELAEEA